MVELDQLRLFRFGFVGVVALAIYSLSGKKRSLWIALALGVPAASGQLAALLSPHNDAPGIAMISGLLFMGYTTLVVIGSVLAEGPVTHDKIAGAICAYLLLGLVFAIAHSIIALFDPGAYRTPEQLALAPWSATEYAFIYYSFVTLSTLGYGEIAPVTHWSRTIAWIEAVVGQLFLAILIARLVGLHIYQSTSKD